MRGIYWPMHDDEFDDHSTAFCYASMSPHRNVGLADDRAHVPGNHAASNRVQCTYLPHADSAAAGKGLRARFVKPREAAARSFNCLFHASVFSQNVLLQNAHHLTRPLPTFQPHPSPATGEQQAHEPLQNPCGPDRFRLAPLALRTQHLRNSWVFDSLLWNTCPATISSTIRPVSQNEVHSLQRGS